jgi:hypothetical protein
MKLIIFTLLLLLITFVFSNEINTATLAKTETKAEPLAKTESKPVESTPESTLQDYANEESSTLSTGNVNTLEHEDLGITSEMENAEVQNYDIEEHL